MKSSNGTPSNKAKIKSTAILSLALAATAIGAVKTVQAVSQAEINNSFAVANASSFTQEYGEEQKTVDEIVEETVAEQRETIQTEVESVGEQNLVNQRTSSNKIQRYLDEIKDSLKETAGTTNEIDYSKLPPEQWLEAVVLNTQNKLLSETSLNFFSGQFDETSEVEQLLIKAVAEKNGKEYTGSATASLKGFISSVGKESFEKEINFLIGRYELFQGAFETIKDLEAGDSIQNPTPEIDINQEKPTELTSAENYDEKRINLWAIIASLAAAAAAVAVTTAILVKRTMSRGRTVRVAGTRYNLGQTSTYAARHLSRVNKKIAKRNNKIKKIQKRIDTGTVAFLKRARIRHINYLQNNAPLTRSRNATKLRLEKKCYYLSDNSQNQPKGKFLKVYARRAMNSARLLGGRNKEFFAEGVKAPTKENYIKLMKGLNQYAKSLIASEKNKDDKSQSLLNKAIETLKDVQLQSIENIYYGKNNSLEIPGLDKKIPVFPERYVSAPSLPKQEQEELQAFFDEVFTINPNLEKSAVYGKITYEDEKIERTITYGFDNSEGSRLIKDKLITLIPETATNISVVETVQKPRKIQTSVLENLPAKSQTEKQIFVNKQKIADTSVIKFEDKIANIKLEQGKTFIPEAETEPISEQPPEEHIPSPESSLTVQPEPVKPIVAESASKSTKPTSEEGQEI